MRKFIYIYILIYLKQKKTKAPLEKKYIASYFTIACLPLRNRQSMW